MADLASQEHSTAPRLIWDLPTRLVHWSIALCFFGSWITAEAGFDWTQTHFRLGYCTLGLVFFRLIWGLIGPKHARFGSFIKGPKQVWLHIRHLWQPGAPEAPGHNALGGWAVVLLLTALGVQAGTGLFLTDDIAFAGPYNPAVSGDTASWLAGIHHWNFRGLQGLVALHLIAIAWYQWRLKQNLVVPMLTGKKSVARVEPEAEIGSSALWRALCLALLAGFGVWLLLSLAPEPAAMDYF